MQGLTDQTVLSFEAESGIKTSGQLPEDLEVFKDHFPDFPILPGVLALEILQQAVRLYYAKQGKASADTLKIHEIRRTKFGQFLKPGDRWESSLELMQSSPDKTRWKGKIHCQGKQAVVTEFIVMNQD